MRFSHSRVRELIVDGRGHEFGKNACLFRDVHNLCHTVPDIACEAIFVVRFLGTTERVVCYLCRRCQCRLRLHKRLAGRWMKELIVRTWLALFWGFALVSSVQAAGWYRDVDEALKVAQSTNRPMVLFVSMDQCKYCHMMIQKTLANVEVRRTIGSSFVAATITAAEQPELMKRLGIRSFPTTLLVDSNGKIIDQMTGYVGVKKFRSQLHRVTGQSSQPAVARSPSSTRSR